MAELAPGTQFGAYRIESVAGQGGMGVVYRATQLGLDRAVGLKVITPAFAHDEEFRARFQRESKLAASIEHPNVIPVYEAGEHDGTLFLAMRFVDGTDLKSLLTREGRLEPLRAPRREAGECAARVTGPRLPDRLRADQARRVRQRNDEDGPDGGDGRLRRAGTGRGRVG